jgi:hypothetical protein
MREFRTHVEAGLGFSRLSLPLPRDQVGIEPVEGLATKLGSVGLVGGRIVLPVSTAGQGGSGGTVAMGSQEILSEFGVLHERFGI